MIEKKIKMKVENQEEESLDNKNLDKLCRLCLKEASNIETISVGDVSVMIENFCDIQIQPNDGLPQNICEFCKLETEKCYSFRSKIIENHKILTGIINKPNSKKPCNVGGLVLKDIVESLPEKNIEDKNKLVCDICFKDLKTISSLRRHMKIHNENETNISWSSLIETGKSQEIEEQYIFKSNNRDVKTVSSLEHVKEENESLSDNENNFEDPSPETDKKENKKEKFICKLCNKDVKSLSSLRRHMKIHSGLKPHVCKICNKGFSEKGNVAKHIMRYHNKVKTVQCNECGAKFYERAKLMIHMRRHTGERPYSCSVCLAAFTTSTQVQTHMKKHTKERPYKCDICGKSFPYNGSLVNHKKIHGDRKHICHCGQSFIQKAHLNTHIMIKHTNKRPFMCSNCGDTFPTKAQLQAHNMHHTGEQKPKRYTCQLCNKGFVTSTELKLHIRVHTNEKPYTCEFCGKKFRSSSHMNSHRRIHTGEKNYVCSYCGKAFRESTSLKIHIRTHTGERPYNCSICHMAFAKTGTLKTHMKVHRKDNKQNTTENINSAMNNNS